MDHKKAAPGAAPEQVNSSKDEVNRLKSIYLPIVYHKCLKVIFMHCAFIVMDSFWTKILRQNEALMWSEKRSEQGP